MSEQSQFICAKDVRAEYPILNTTTVRLFEYAGLLTGRKDTTRAVYYSREELDSLMNLLNEGKERVKQSRREWTATRKK